MEPISCDHPTNTAGCSPTHSNHPDKAQNGLVRAQTNPRPVEYDLDFVGDRSRSIFCVRPVAGLCQRRYSVAYHRQRSARRGRRLEGRRFIRACASRFHLKAFIPSAFTRWLPARRWGFQQGPRCRKLRSSYLFRRLQSDYGGCP